MVRLAVLVIGDQGLAEDVVQDVFAEVHRRADRLDADRIEGYLRVAVLNRARSSARRRRPWSVFGHDHEQAAARSAPPGDGPEGAALRDDREQQVLAVLARLPRRQREVVVLRYWLDMSEAQIAQTLGISAGTVKSSASRAMRALEAGWGTAR